MYRFDVKALLKTASRLRLIAVKQMSKYNAKAKTYGVNLAKDFFGELEQSLFGNTKFAPVAAC